MKMKKILWGALLLLPFIVSAETSQAAEKRIRILENQICAMQLPPSRERGEALLAILRDDPETAAPLFLLKECIKTPEDKAFFAAELALLAKQYPGIPRLALAAVQFGTDAPALLLNALQTADDPGAPVYAAVLTEYIQRLPSAPAARKASGEKWLADELALPDSPWRDRVLTAAAEYWTHEKVQLRDSAEKQLGFLKMELRRREDSLKNAVSLYEYLGLSQEVLRLVSRDSSPDTWETLFVKVRSAIAAKDFERAAGWLGELLKLQRQSEAGGAEHTVIQDFADSLECELLLKQKKYDEAKAKLDSWGKSDIGQGARFQYYYVTKQFDEALKIAGKLEDSIAVTCKLMLAEKMRDGTLLDEVAAELKKNGKLDDPDNANSVGYIDAELNHNLKRAETLLVYALSCNPGEAAYLDSMAHLQYRLGNFAEAEKWINQALSRMMPSPELSVLYDHAGDIQTALKNPGKALRYYRAALQYDPEEPEKIEAKIKKIEKP